ncbi:MAG: hypothetical protein LBP69_07275 [Treponema sp.]|jgi:hypothetical protein|nr:hypothetical protein [Treponema sp.]
MRYFRFRADFSAHGAFCVRLLCAAAVCLAFFSCATVDPYTQVDHLVETEAFPQSVEVLEESSKKIYRGKDRVLYYLDKGMLSHYAEDWGGSSALLQQGERAIEENFAVSISQEIGTYLVNDLSREYDGEDYEDLYLNVFNALNYYHRSKDGEVSLDEALVEIRRMDNKLKNLSVKYGTMISTLQKAALENNTEIPPNPETPREFSNSALARYLGMLFYRGEGAMDDARIDRDGLKLAFADYPDIYSHPVPSSIDGELEIPPGMARLNVLGFSGRLPVKTEETLRIPIGLSWIKIALPVLASRPSRIESVQVVFDSGERFDLELLEDIGKVAKTTFARKQDVIYLRTIIRATVKGVSAAVLNAMAETDDEHGALFSVLGIGAQIFAEASEKADLRSTRYFPGKVYAGGINLEPGIYSFTVAYYGINGDIVAKRYFENMEVKANKLNLTEAVCLK